MYFTRAEPLLADDGLLLAGDGLLYSSEQGGLVTDRTQDDVNRAEKLNAMDAGAMSDAEKAEWFSGMKGAYNCADLNRVGEAVQCLADVLKGYGYAVRVAAKRDWTGDDAPNEGQMVQYLADIAAVREALTVWEDTPATPETMQGLTWQAANDIEKILEDVEAAICRMELTWFYTGEIYCGEA